MGGWLIICIIVQLTWSVHCVDLVLSHDKAALIDAADLVNLHSHSGLKKRSVADESSCLAKYSVKYNPDNITNGARNVHQFNYTASSYDVVQMIWTGENDETQLIALLNSEGKVSSDMEYSSDHRSFNNVTLTYKDHPLTDYKISLLGRNPDDNTHVLMIGYTDGQYISCVSQNSGVTLTCYPLMEGYEPVTSFMFQGSNICTLLKRSSWGFLIAGEQILVYSKDFGKTWSTAVSGVTSAQWHPSRRNVMLAQVTEVDERYTIAMFQNNYIKQIDVSGSTAQVKTLAGLGKTVVYGFQYVGKFIHVTAQDSANDGHKVLKISSDDGATFHVTHLPTATTSQSIDILDSSQSLVFAHISHQTDSTMGSLYTSGSDGLYYSLSLENHVSQDFYMVLSVQGVYITSRKLTDDSLQTMITHDRGVNWKPLSLRSNCDDLKTCGLQVYGGFMLKYYQYRGRIIGKPAISQSNAPGILIVHGKTGDRVTYDSQSHEYVYNDTTVFVSGDGGITWTQTSLQSVYHVEILDSGSILIAHEVGKDDVNLKFSVDEGGCWLDLPLESNTSISVRGMVTKPGAQSLSVGLLGLNNSTGQQYWTMIDVNFKTIINTQCGDTDIQLWQPKSDCYLGMKTIYKRIKLNSWCYLNANHSIKPVSKTQCDCSKLRDLQCDYGYRKQDSGDCVQDDNWTGDKVIYCLSGVQYQLKTRGYRKIAGTQCKDTEETKSLTTNQSVSLHTDCDNGDTSSFLSLQDVCQQQSICTGNAVSSESYIEGYKIAVALLSLTVIGLIVIIVLLIKRGAKICHSGDNYDRFDENLSDFRYGGLTPSSANNSTDERMGIANEGSSNSKTYSRLNEEQAQQSDVDLLNL